MIRVAIAGASGRMGRMLVEAVLAAPDIELAGALDLASSPSLGRDAGEFLGRDTGVRVTDSLDEGLAGADTLIDFTRPQGTLAHLDACVARGVRMVIGTTGFDESGSKAIRDASQRIAIVFAPNMSVGVNATFKLLAMAAKILDEGYDIEVIEAHHRNKVDAPSGTALEMGRIVAAALERDFDRVAVYGREGVTGERDRSTIGFSAVRGGDIVGEHTVLFAGIGERIEITHRASSRQGYATGSLRAAATSPDTRGGCSTCTTCSACANRSSRPSARRRRRRHRATQALARVGARMRGRAHDQIETRRSVAPEHRFSGLEQPDAQDPRRRNTRREVPRDADVASHVPVAGNQDDRVPGRRARARQRRGDRRVARELRVDRPGHRPLGQHPAVAVDDRCDHRRALARSPAGRDQVGHRWRGAARDRARLARREVCRDQREAFA